MTARVTRWVDCSRCKSRGGDTNPLFAQWDEDDEEATILCQGCLNGDGPPSTSGLRVRGVIMERVRPIRWLWQRRIPLGLPSLILGEEGMGKGTVAAWITAKATRGELDGDLGRADQRPDHRRRGRLRVGLGPEDEPRR